MRGLGFDLKPPFCFLVNGSNVARPSGPDGAANSRPKPCADPRGKGSDQLAAPSGYRRSYSPIRKAAQLFPRSRYGTGPPGRSPPVLGRSRGGNHKKTVSRSIHCRFCVQHIAGRILPGFDQVCVDVIVRVVGVLRVGPA
jgi:hypothetical protein